MNSRTRPPSSRRSSPEQQQDPFERLSEMDLESLSDEELEAMLFKEEEKAKSSIWNLPTVAGLSLIVVGMVYLFQEIGLWNGFDVSAIAAMLPWMAGVLIILLGFGVLSWRPRRGKRKKVKKGIEIPTGKEKVVVEPDAADTDQKKRLHKSRDKVLAGVCGGIAEYFNIDPTLVRIAFVIGTFFYGSLFMAYLVLAFVMPSPDKVSEEERIRIIRDS